MAEIEHASFIFAIGGYRGLVPGSFVKVGSGGLVEKIYWEGKFSCRPWKRIN